MNDNTYLLGLATAVPANRFSQGEIKQRAKKIFGGRTALFDVLEPVYTNAGIDTRYSCQPMSWFDQPSDIADKSKLYQQSATDLALDAARKALDLAGLGAEDIDALVFVSSTGIATPTIDARLMNLLPFRRDVVRLPIFGLGCAGGVMGLSRAASLIAGRRKMRCLFITVELCTLAFRYDKLNKSNLVATALFADGAAAAVLSSEPEVGHVAELGAAGEHSWQNTLNIMGWNVDSNGFDVVFHRKIPDFVVSDFRPALDDFLQRQGINLDEFVRPCCHPGGAKVIEALEQALVLQPETLDFERQVLRNYGNMSAPTVLFVLKEILASGLSGSVLMTSLGPGFSAAFQSLVLNGSSKGQAS